MNRKKILFILHLPPPVHGAAMVGQFLKNSSIINTAFEADYINLTTASSHQDIGKTSFNKIYTFLKLQLRILSTLSKKNYDLCYVSLNAKGAGYYKDLVVILLLKLFRKRIVYHFHNRGVSTMQDKKINDLLYGYTFKGSKSILLSRLLYSDIAKYVSEANVFYCPNGIPAPDGLESISGTDLRLNGKCKLLFLSNMVVEKGVFVLLDACRILYQKGVDFECQFVGDWVEFSKDQIRKRVEENGLVEKISLHGKKFGHDKLAFFRNADIFVFPTYYHNECFPLVNLEAMQFALPVVTTSIGGIPDMVLDQKTGFIVPPKDAESLAEKLEFLIKNPEVRVKMGQAGRRLYEQSFTLNTFELNMKNILENAIQN